MIERISEHIPSHRKWKNMTEKLENFTNAQKYEIKLPAGQSPRCQTCKSTMEIIRPTKAKYVLTLNGLYEQWT